jgi:magnesium-transporting ATPase (P-type)
VTRHAIRPNTSRVDPGRLPTGVATLAYTYGQGFFTIALVVWIVVWLFVAGGVIRRRDLGIVGKLVWLVVILVIPLVGLFIYFLWSASRPAQA